MNRRLLMFSALILVGLAAVLIFGGEKEPEDLLTQSGVRSPIRTHEVERSEGGTPETRLEQAPIEARPFDEGEAEAEHQRNLPVLMKVVARGSTVGLAGARVEYQGRERAGENGLVGGPIRLSTVTDAKGLVRLPSGVFARVKVSWRDLWGEGWVIDRAELQVLELDPSRGLELSVRDHEGRAAAGVPVVITRPLGERRQTLRTEISDAKGQVVFDNLHRLVSEEGLLIGFAIPLLDSPLLELNEKLLVERKAELRLPPCGSLAIHCIGPEGLPLGPGDVTLTMSASAASEGTLEPATKELTGLAPDAEGMVRVPRLGLGLSLWLSLESVQPDRGLYPASLTLPGPTNAGEEITAELQLRRKTRVRARIVDEQGEPWKGGFLEGRERFIPRAFGFHRTEVITVGPDGRIEVVLNLEPRSPEDLHRLELVELDAQKSYREDARSVTVALDGLEAGADHDLGDLVLAQAPAFLSGILIDAASGAPVLKGEMRLFEELASGEQLPLWAVFKRQENGRFRFTGRDRSPLPTSKLSVRYFGPFCPSYQESRRFRVGETEVVLRIPQQGVLRGAVVFKKSSDASQLSAAFRSRDGRWTFAEIVMDHVNFGLGPAMRPACFDFRVPACEKGTLVIVPAGVDPEVADAVIARVEGVQVRTGEVTELGFIPLPELPSAKVMTVVDVLGKPLMMVEVSRLRGNDRTLVGVTGQYGELKLILRSPVDLEFARRGYAAVTLSGVHDSERVVLHQAPVLTLKLKGLPFPAENLEVLGLSPDLRFLGPGGGKEEALSNAKAGEFRFRPRRGGEYEVIWRAFLPGAIVEFKQLDRKARTIIRVKGNVGPEVIAVELPSMVIKHLDGLRRKHRK